MKPSPRIEIKRYPVPDDIGRKSLAEARKIKTFLAAIVHRDRTIEYIEQDTPELKKCARKEARRVNFEMPYDEDGHYKRGENMFFID